MSTLTGTKIKDTYPGLMKTADNAALGATEKNIEDGLGNASTLSMGTASASFTGTLDLSGATVTGLPAGGGLEPVQLSGTSQTLDLGTYNFFDGGTLAGDTTLTFSNVPAEARFQYTYEVGINPYKVQNSSYNGIFWSLGTTYHPIDMSFNNDGTKAYVLRGDATADQVYQFSLATAYDITTATYDSISLAIEAQDNQHTAIFFKPDGTQFWTVGQQNSSVYQYDLTTAWDLSTASYSSTSFSVSTFEAFPTGLVFKTDGTQFFIVGRGTDQVRRFSMSTAWDITTATHDNNTLVVQSQDGEPHGLVMNPDGTKVIIGGDASDKIYEYTLSTAFDLTTGTNTAEYDFGADVTGGTIRGLTTNGNGKNLYVTLPNSDIIYEVSFGAASVIYPASVQNAPTKVFKNGDVVTQTFYTLDAGTSVFFEEEPQDAASLPGMVAGSGTDAIASSSAITSVGAIASGTGSIAIGNDATALDTNNITIGVGSDSDGTNIINIGDNNDMSGYSDNTVLIRPGGGTSIAFRGSSVSLGVNSYPGANAVAIGYNARGGQNDANIVIGQNAYATGDGVAIGENTDAIGVRTVAIGSGAQATGAGADGKIAIGWASATSNKAIAIGVNGTTVGSEGIALGDNVDIATSDRSIGIGNAINISGGNDKIAIGTAASVTGTRGIALGQNSSATASEAIALGYNVTAATASTTTVNLFQIAGYASMNYADDTAAAAGGIPLGGVYHTNGALKIRIA